MLRYLSSGSRTWARDVLETRANWEFMAIVEGSAKPDYDGNSGSEPFVSKRLWIMPPLSSHRWCTLEGRECKVVVFHFSSIPTVIRQMLGGDKVCVFPLSNDDIEILHRVHQEVTPHYEKPDIRCHIWFEQALLDLCILVAGKIRSDDSVREIDSASIKVQQALYWYSIHLRSASDLKPLYAALATSKSDLEKLFKNCLNETPQQAFRRVALDQARCLMAESSLSLKEIASHCGFGSVAQLRRACNQLYKVSPQEWRENRFYGKLGFKSKPPPASSD